MPSLHDYIVTYMKTNPFALVNDGLSDTGLNKMNPACALIFDVSNFNEVGFKFFDMCPTTRENCCQAETLFKAIDSALELDGILWANCVNMGVDNTNSNVEIQNTSKNPNCFIAGCSSQHIQQLVKGVKHILQLVVLTLKNIKSISSTTSKKYLLKRNSF